MKIKSFIYAGIKSGKSFGCWQFLSPAMIVAERSCFHRLVCVHRGVGEGVSLLLGPLGVGLTGQVTRGEVGILGGQVSQGVGKWGVGIWGRYRGVGIPTPPDTYPLPHSEPSGGHQNRYSWQAGSMHTVILSCCLKF